MTKLASTTVGVGGVSSITFSNIPQNYTDLVVVASVRSSTTGSAGTGYQERLNIYFNGPTVNYSDRWIQAEGGEKSEATQPAPKIVVPTNSTSASTSTTAVAAATGSTTTAVARMATESNAVTDAGSETNASGRYVFIGVCAVIAIGAGVLFLKYRKHPTKG
jgi:hypothetical protein